MQTVQAVEPDCRSRRKEFELAALRQLCEDSSVLDSWLCSDGLTLRFIVWCDVKESVFRSKVNNMNYLITWIEDAVDSEIQDAAEHVTWNVLPLQSLWARVVLDWNCPSDSNTVDCVLCVLIWVVSCGHSDFCIMYVFYVVNYFWEMLSDVCL
jgi:hypothetical protein